MLNRRRRRKRGKCSTNLRIAPPVRCSFGRPADPSAPHFLRAAPRLPRLASRFSGMTFDDFLRRRRLDVDAFRSAEPVRAAQWADWYAQMHPDSFLLQIKMVLNDVRRRYHLAEAPAPPPAVEGAAVPARPSGRRARPVGPTVSDANPTVSDANPTVSDANPTVSDANPTVSDANPTVSNGNPTVSNANPTVSNENTTVSNENTTVSNENTTVSNENPTARPARPRPVIRRPAAGSEVPAAPAEAAPEAAAEQPETVVPAPKPAARPRPIIRRPSPPPAEGEASGE